MKKRIVLLIILLIVLSIFKISYASNTYNATTTDNGKELSWSYELDDSNQIINLKCTNKSDIDGNVSIPIAINGRKVKSIGNEAFSGCNKLTGVELGKVEGIGKNAFRGCAGLRSIKIPKTLKETVVIIDSIFGDCTNLTQVTLEEGLEKIPNNLLVGTHISEITIPDSVKTIEYGAFSGIKELNSINLGKVEGIRTNAFRGCTGLTSIKIPKTLKETVTIIDSIFGDCTNLTHVTLEDGLEKIPNKLLVGTHISEITIPNSVNAIEYGSFSNIEELVKITILDNVTIMGNKIFDGHNEDLTIYCYENSVAAQYAIDNNIKYVYLERDTFSDNTYENSIGNEQKEHENGLDDTLRLNKQAETGGDDNTIINKSILPQTGISKIIVLIVIGLSLIGIFTYKRYSKLKDIK